MTATVRPKRTPEQHRWIRAAANRAEVIVAVNPVLHRRARLLAWNIDRRAGTARVEFVDTGSQVTVPQSTIELVEVATA
jgi:hypothetical protein